MIRVFQTFWEMKSYTIYVKYKNQAEMKIGGMQDQAEAQDGARKQKSLATDGLSRVKAINWFR
jgi:hypothetical protein